MAVNNMVVMGRIVAPYGVYGWLKVVPDTEAFDGLFDYDILDFAGPGATMALCDFNHHNPGIIGGGLLANEFS